MYAQKIEAAYGLFSARAQEFKCTHERLRRRTAAAYGRFSANVWLEMQKFELVFDAKVCEVP